MVEQVITPRQCLPRSGRRYELSVRRRQLPMVRIEKAYLFEGPEGKTSLLHLFMGRRELIRLEPPRRRMRYMNNRPSVLKSPGIAVDKQMVRIERHLPGPIDRV